jgi:hypothetical protein
MADHKEQRICITFWYNLKKTASGTCKWYSHFRSGQNLVEDFECSGHHQETDENVEKVHQVIHKDRWDMIVFVTF